MSVLLLPSLPQFSAYSILLPLDERKILIQKPRALKNEESHWFSASPAVLFLR